jgi:hypothetical protein
LENELRFLYKDILVPWQKRIDDHQCSDLRDIRTEMKNEQVESVVAHLLRLVESKGMMEEKVTQK